MKKTVWELLAIARRAKAGELFEGWESPCGDVIRVADATKRQPEREDTPYGADWPYPQVGDIVPCITFGSFTLAVYTIIPPGESWITAKRWRRLPDTCDRDLCAPQDLPWADGLEQYPTITNYSTCTGCVG
jgi:hypothetical protein